MGRQVLLHLLSRPTELQPWPVFADDASELALGVGVAI